RRGCAGPGSATSSSAGVGEAIAGAADRLDRVAANLLAEVVDVHGDDVRAIVVVHIPALFEQFVPREHMPRPAHEQLEQRELLRRELDLDLTAPDTLRGGIELQVTGLEHCRP